MRVIKLTNMRRKKVSVRVFFLSFGFALFNFFRGVCLPNLLFILKLLKCLIVVLFVKFVVQKMYFIGETRLQKQFDLGNSTKMKSALYFMIF